MDSLQPEEASPQGEGQLKRHLPIREAVSRSCMKRSRSIPRTSVPREDRGVLVQAEDQKFLLVEANPEEHVVVGRVLPFVGSHLYALLRLNVGTEVHRMPRRGIEVEEEEILHRVEAELLVLQDILAFVQKYHSPQERVNARLDRCDAAPEGVVRRRGARSVEGLSHISNHPPDAMKRVTPWLAPIADVE